MTIEFPKKKARRFETQTQSVNDFFSSLPRNSTVREFVIDNNTGPGGKICLVVKKHWHPGSDGIHITCRLYFSGVYRDGYWYPYGYTEKGWRVDRQYYKTVHVYQDGRERVMNG